MDFVWDKIFQKYLAEHVHGYVPFEDCQVLGLLDDGDIMAVASYYSWSPTFKNLEFTFASATPRWATRENIRGFFDYPFNYLKCERVHSLVHPENERCISNIERLGFVYEGTARKGFFPDDALIYSLLKEEAQRWL
jgi:hypothetical protein